MHLNDASTSPDRILSPLGMQTKQEILLQSLLVYFQNDHSMRILSNILIDNHLSLRLIDYFVTTYSKIFNVGYRVDDTAFNVFIGYKSVLKGYSKRHFDVFCRRERVSIYSQTHKRTIETTPGQLHFFSWAIKNNIIDYIQQHVHEIEEHMLASLHNKKTQQPNAERKKMTVVASNQRGVTSARVKLVLSFE